MGASAHIPNTTLLEHDFPWHDGEHSRVRTTVRVDELGRGQPIVFLHGLLGLNDHWLPVSRSLCERARCLMIEAPLLELRGESCSVAGVVRLISTVLDAIVGAPAVLVGNSLGGHVAQRIALERPELCRAIVLAGSSGLFERTFEKDVQHRPSLEWLTRKIGDLFYDPANMPPNCVELAFQELSDRRAARALVKLGKSAKIDHMGDRLGSISQPTLLLWGRNDTVTPPDVATEFHAKLPDSRLVWLDKCGHAPMIERPREFAAALHEFLDEIGDAAPAPDACDDDMEPEESA